MSFDWFVGLFEGEGCVVQSKKYPQNFVLDISMTDKDVLDRIPPLVGGSIYGPKKQYEPHHKLQWGWREASTKRSVPLLRAMLPLLGDRRAEKVRQCLLAYDTWQAAKPRGPGSRGGPGSRPRRHHSGEAVSATP